MNSSGDLIWSKTIGGLNDEGVEGSIFEANGGYYFASASNSKDNDCADTSWCPGVFTDYDCYLFLLDTAGNVQWAKSYGGSGGEGFRRAIFDERDSTIVSIGTTGSTDYMVTQNSNPQIASLWLVKTDLNGNLIWQKRLGDTAADSYNPSIFAVDGGYMISSLEEDIQQTDHIGFNDMLIYLLDTSGTILSDKLIGGTDNEFPVSALAYKQGYAAIGSSISYTFTEGVNENTNHTSLYQTDIFISGLYDLPLKVKTLNKSDNLKVYPNPATGIFKVTLPTGAEGTLQIADGNGKIVFSQQAKNRKDLEVNTSAWGKGLYMVRWEGKSGEQHNAKLIIR